MTPEELAARHPRLYHLTLPSNLPTIERHGLLSTAALLDLYGVQGNRRKMIEGTCRRTTEMLDDPVHGPATINDQSPMSDAALRKCLHRGLGVADWLALLNGRVFFWASKKGLQTLAGAKANRGLTPIVLEFCTVNLVEAYKSRVELSPLNSGNTTHDPVRRGKDWFSPLGKYSYVEWSKLRGKKAPDVVREVTILGGVTDYKRYLAEPLSGL